MRLLVRDKALWGIVCGCLLLAAALVAIRPAAAQQADTQAQAQAVADVLDRHSDIDEATSKLGSAAFQSNCAACHDKGVGRAPPTSMIGNLAPEAILQVITEGQMKVQAASLSAAQKQAVAEFLTGRKIGESATVGPLMCQADPAWFDLAEPPALKGWGLDRSNGHAIPTAVAGLDRANVGRLKLKWAFAFPGVLTARSQPAIAGGAIFVGSDDGKVYALDPASGCARWVFTASGGVRQGVVVSDWKAGDSSAAPRVYFGDVLDNEYALDAQSGKLVWRRKMDAHPNATLTGSPALAGGTLYVPVSSLEEPAAAVASYQCCTFRGSVAALDAATGEEKWRAWMTDEPQPTGKNGAGVQQFGPSGVAIWSTPVIDSKRGKLYVATGNNYSDPTSRLSDAIVAIDLASGSIDWAFSATESDTWNVACGFSAAAGNCPEVSGDDGDFGAAPVLAKGNDGKDYILAGNKAGRVYAVDPDSGKLVWKQQVGRGGHISGGIHFGIAAAGGKVFVPVSDLDDGGTYDRPARPGVFALDVATGREVWAAPGVDVCGGARFCHPGYDGAITVTPELVLAGSMDGHLRALDAESGKALWDSDTNLPFKTVNGTTAHGGSFGGGAAPVAWHGMLILSSGYGFLGKMPGNVMLVYGRN